MRDGWPFYRDRRPEAYDELVRPSSTASRVTPHGRRHHQRHRHHGPGPVTADVLVEGERSPRSCTPTRRPCRIVASADRVIDAAGKYVVPGGIDVHTHMEMPFGGTFSSDTFETGTRAAAFGGTTTIVDFAVQAKGGPRRPPSTPGTRRPGNCAIDYAFHAIMSGVNDRRSRRWTSSSTKGITSFKLFMAYPGVFYSTTARSCGRCSRPRRTAV